MARVAISRVTSSWKSYQPTNKYDQIIVKEPDVYYSTLHSDDGIKWLTLTPPGVSEFFIYNIRGIIAYAGYFIQGKTCSCCVTWNWGEPLSFRTTYIRIRSSKQPAVCRSIKQYTSLPRVNMHKETLDNCIVEESPDSKSAIQYNTNFLSHIDMKCEQEYKKLRKHRTKQNKKCFPILKQHVS